ncbi:MAG: DUF1501 domain-containing protein, partial [Armatimonadetes bacterium]|nr:DUF1501 domain-containing protein [Armatimonadota bacterium]
MPPRNHLPPVLGRRDLLFRAGQGFGGLALTALLAQDGLLPTAARAAAPGGTNPLAPRPAPRPAKATSVIFLFMVGGPSHIETFDPKPQLDRMDGEQLPQSYGEIKSQFIKPGTPLMGSNWRFHRYGRSGLEISELYPHLATCADDLAMIRSCHSESFVHAPAMYQLLTGRTQAGHPSVGSWVTYGLGSVSENLPAYCVMTQPEGLPEGGAPMWGAGYLPAVHQGTLLRSGATPILHLTSPPGVTRERRRRTLDYLRTANQLGDTAGGGTDLSARIESYELAFRMQQHAPEAADLAQESPRTRELYGLDAPTTREFGTRCLLARRLVERGVRFVQLYSGGGPLSWQWDAHDNVLDNHTRMCARTDRPIAALLKDLKQRGLLETTLVIWGSEFGRTPVTQNGKGRDHNPYGYTMWMAGGGVRGGQVIGATDE